MMIEKKTRKFGKKRFLIAGMLVILVGAAAAAVLPRVQAQSNNGTTTYRTQVVSKGNLSTTVGANGNVYTKQSISMSWQTSGIVSQVDVTKGQYVEKGTVLAELDPSSVPQDVINAAVDLATAKENLADLLNSNTSRANAELALINAEQALVDAQKAAQSKLYQRASQTVIDTAKANMIQAQDALDQAAEIYNQNKNRSTDDSQYAAALSHFAAAQQTFDTAQMNYQYVQSLPDPLSIEKVNAEVDVAQAAYTDAKRAWERVKDGPAADDVAAAQAKVTAAQAIMDEAKIIAPISGTITSINTTPGDLVSAQTSAFQIDDMSHLFVDISVSELDINQVKVGQPAEITFDAISDKTYSGEVTDIATTGNSSSGAVNFSATVELTSKDDQIKPGMTATANITVTQSTGVLLVPASAIRTINDQSIVYIEQNSNLQPVIITTGDTDGTSTIVTGGNLAEGDLLVTNPPSSTSTSTTTTIRSGGLLGGLFGGIFGGGGGGPDGNFGGPSGAPPSGNFNRSSSSQNSSGSSSGNSGNTQSR